MIGKTKGRVIGNRNLLPRGRQGFAWGLGFLQRLGCVDHGIQINPFFHHRRGLFQQGVELSCRRQIKRLNQAQMAGRHINIRLIGEYP